MCVVVCRSSDTKRAVWRLGDFPGPACEESSGLRGSITAKMAVVDGPSSPTPVAMQFVCEGCNLSGADFELAGPGYRVSLIKKRFITGELSRQPLGFVLYS